MSELAIEVVATTDPNTMRFCADKTLNPTRPVAYYDAEAARRDAVAGDFFAVEGVAGLMIVNAFCAVHKAEAADWGELVPRIESVMRRHWG